MRCPTLRELPPPPPGKAGWPWTEESPQLPDTMPDGSPWPRMSIVTSSYNQAQFIQETIRSVLLQGYPDLEYIIIDGGSTDGSVDIIRKYEPRLAYWVSEPDRGQSHAINKGWEHATGTWLGWLNSDDTYLPSVLSRIRNYLLAEAHLDLIYGDCQYVNEQGVPRDLITEADFDLRTMLLRGGMIHTPAVFWRRRLNDLAGRLDEGYHFSLDNDFWLRVVPHARCQYVPGAMGTFRRHEGSKTVRAELELVRETYHIFRQRLDELPYASLLSEGEKRQVLGGFVWLLAVQLQGIGRAAEAQRYFRKAIEVYRILDTPDVAALRTVKQLLENRVVSREQVTNVLAALPLQAEVKRRFEAIVWDHYQQVRFYGGFQRKEAVLVLSSALPMIRLAPRRLLQRGFISICVRSLLSYVLPQRTAA